MMIDTILNNIPETLTLGSVIVGGSAWLGKYWSSQLIEKVKSKSARDIESLRADYQKEIRVLDEKFKLEVLKFENHLQVSKSTCEIIFDKKVEVYGSLMALRNKYYRYKNESVMVQDDPLDAIETFYTCFMECKSILEDNSLYISEALSSLYDEWMDIAIKHFKQESVDGHEVHGMAYTDEENQQNIHDAQFSARNALVNDTQDLMEQIFNQINDDIRKIRCLVTLPLEENLRVGVRS